MIGAFIGLGDVARADGDLAGAAARYSEAIRIARDPKEPSNVAAVLRSLAALLGNGHRWQTATRLIRAAEEVRSARRF